MSTIDQYLTAVEARTETIETTYEQESYDDNYTVTVVSSRMYQAIEASSWDVPDLTKALRVVLKRCDRMAATKGESERAYALRDTAADVRAEILAALTEGTN